MLTVGWSSGSLAHLIRHCNSTSGRSFLHISDARSVCLPNQQVPTLIKSTPLDVLLFLRPADVILPLNFFFFFCHSRSKLRDIAISEVYQWLGLRCRHEMTLIHFANHFPNFYRGSKVRNFASIFDTSRLRSAIVSKRSNMSEITAA